MPSNILAIDQIISKSKQNAQGASINTLGQQAESKVPKIINVGQSLASSYTGITQLSGITSDFRSYKPLLDRRLDGTQAASRKSATAAAYAAASLVDTYAVFNLNGTGKTGYGWGDHGSRLTLRNDFTAMSNINTKWRDGEWKPTRNPLELATPFTGDKVQVIDFGKRTLAEAYLWKPKRLAGKEIFGKILNNFDVTQDFIKFMFTGPKLRNGDPNADDDIIIFRAVIDSLEDSFNPNWNPQNMIGRADPNYIYQGVSRSVNLTFKVYATTRDEMKPIWRKLNALAGYTAPSYNEKSITMEAPWMRITIGDLFHQQAIVITSLSYTLAGNDTTWEINIEKDPEMMQAPHYVSVNMQLNVITDALPEKGGRFYALTQMNNYDEDGISRVGSNNWLSNISKQNQQTLAELKKAERESKRADRKQQRAAKNYKSLGGATEERVVDLKKFDNYTAYVTDTYNNEVKTAYNGITSNPNITILRK